MPRRILFTAAVTTTPISRIRRVQKTSQPKTNISINNTNQITRGLVALINNGTGIPYDAIGGSRWEGDPFTNGSMYLVPTSAGMGRGSNPGETRVDAHHIKRATGADVTILVFWLNNQNRGSGNSSWIASRLNSNTDANRHWLLAANNQGSGPQVQFLVENTANGQFVVTHQSFTSATIPQVFIGRYDDTTKIVDVWQDGIKCTTTATLTGTSRTPVAADQLFDPLALGNRYPNFTAPAGGPVIMAALWDRPLSDIEIASVSANPWQLFAPSTIKFTTQSVVITSAITPGSDVTTSGWTTTGSTFYGELNEEPYNDASYITSPNISGTTTYTLIMGLSGSLATGSYDVALRAKCSSTQRVRVHLLDDSNTTLGTSSWQNASGTYTSYTLPVTITGTATRIKIEVANI